MDKIKKGLGRGLSSLIGEAKVEAQRNQLLVSDLVPNKYQPRKIFDENNLIDLTNSIKERGMIQPIIVRKSNDENTKFEIGFSGITELDEKIQEMMVVDKMLGIFTCTVCDKTTKHRNDMKRHIETHIDGLSFPCSKCDKTFRSRNNLYKHKFRYHK